MKNREEKFLGGVEMSIRLDGRINFSFPKYRGAEEWLDFALRESITLPEGKVYVEPTEYSPKGFIEKTWGTLVGEFDFSFRKEQILKAGGVVTPREGYCFPLVVRSTMRTKDSKKLSAWLDQGSTCPTLEDLFWGEDMPRRSEKDRTAYFVYLDELRKEARGGKETPHPKEGSDRPQLDGGRDATIVRRGGNTVAGKIYVSGDVALVDSAAYGVAARLINTTDIPSDGVIDLEIISSLRVVHAGRNHELLENLRGE
jgi:hypothetical protein